jgi:hypothetical protein
MWRVQNWHQRRGCFLVLFFLHAIHQSTNLTLWIIFCSLFHGSEFPKVTLFQHWSKMWREQNWHHRRGYFLMSVSCFPSARNSPKHKTHALNYIL